MRTAARCCAVVLAALTTLTAGILWIAGARGVVAASPPEQPPNILVLVADDAGWNDFGAYGNPYIRTPNIDKLARSGILFERAFLTASQCSPSRISILTGKYPHATGAEDLHTPLPEDQSFVTTHLETAGYFTGCMKKTHFGPNGERQFNWYSEHTADAFASFLDQAGDRPFLLWVGFTDPHRPYGDAPKRHDRSRVVVPPQLVDSLETRQDLALYYDEIARMDDEVGRFVSELERRELTRRTLIVFFSDNGMPFPRAKGTVYDAGVRTPLIVSWPGVVPRGVRYKGLTSVIDLAPTFIDLAGLPVSSEMQGSSIRSILLDPSLSGRRFLFSERNWHNCDEHIRSVRSERYRLVLNAYTHLPFGSPADISSSPSWYPLVERRRIGALTPEQARLFETPRARVELYDLENDPGEFVNLAERPDYRDTAIELLAELNQWMEVTGDFPPTERRRPDNTDRITGVKFGPQLPAMLPK